MRISNILINWYRKNKRELSCRGTRNPYKIWLSEVILQQTQVVQGIAYYDRFVEKYPDCKSLALASEDEILKLWQGLGYYSRARNMHKAAQQIQTDFKGRFPTTYKDILSLKGVGEYTASAIVSIAFDMPYAAVDGNVYRVLSRLFGVATPIDTGAGKKEFTDLANSILDKKKSGEHNQAIMEFGALVCTPKSPNCRNCPFVQECVAAKERKINELPAKSKKIKQRKRYFHYLHITKDDTFYIRQRKAKDIWQNLYELPLIENVELLPVDELLNNSDFKAILQNTTFEIRTVSEQKIHKLTHQTIFAIFIKIEIIEGEINCADCKRISTDELSKYAVPKLIESFFF